MNYEQEAIKPYGAEEGKAQQVEQMFDNIAPSYDKLNHRLSWNIDKGWRRKAICQLEPHKPPRHRHRHRRLRHPRSRDATTHKTRGS